MALKVASMGLGTRSDLLLPAILLPQLFAVNVHDQFCYADQGDDRCGQKCGAGIGLQCEAHWCPMQGGRRGE
jgi:hypothetical protein